MLKEFKKFLLRGNVIDLAVGVVIGAAFNAVVTSLTADFLSPVISVITKGPNLNRLAFGVDGVEFMYGHFLNTLISFILVSATVFFFVVKPVNLLIEKTRKSPPPDPTTKKCLECLSEIPIAARRCSYCTQIIS